MQHFDIYNLYCSSIFIIVMNSSVLQYQLRTHMAYGQQYTFLGMKSLYGQIMNQDTFIIYTIISDKTFRNKINEWSNVDDGWLQKEGRGRDARYYKRDTFKPIRWSKYYEKAMRILNRGKSLWAK